MTGLPDRYEPIVEIGRGGMGVVWRVHDLDLDRVLAVKSMRRQTADIDRARFRREARITGGLQHPGIPPVVECGELADGLPFFSMKLVEGRTFAELLGDRTDRTHQLSQSLAIFQQVCQAVGYAHSRGVIHRDLKPSNVMVGAFGEVQVMDWGMAKTLPPVPNDDSRVAVECVQPPSPDTALAANSADRTTVSFETDIDGMAETVVAAASHDAFGDNDSPDAALTGQGWVMGTPAYMAPEQARGEIGRLDARSDVFSLGAILCEIITGRPAIQGSNAYAIVDKAQQEDLSEALDRVDACDADEELVDLVKRCLAAKPQDRPGDAGKVAALIADYLAGLEERLQAAQVDRERQRVLANEERRRRKLWVGLAGVVVIACLAGGSAWLWYRLQVADRETRAESALNEAVAMRKAENWTGALAAARRSSELLEKGGGDDDLRTRVRKALAELELVARLEAAHERQINLTKVSERRRGKSVRHRVRNIALRRFAEEKAIPEYIKAFSTFDIEVNETPPKQAAEVIRRCSPAIRGKIVAALDNWHRLATVYRTGHDAWLNKVLADADPDPWRTKARQANGRRDGKAFAAVVGELELTAQPPTTLWWSANVLSDTYGMRKSAIALLRRAQLQYPGDFWINENLGLYLLVESPDQPREALRFLGAALSLQPRKAAAYLNYGVGLFRSGNLVEAETTFRRAAELQPGSFAAHFDLGYLLIRLNKPRAAEAALKKSVELSPDSAAAYFQLAVLYYSQKRLPEAAAAARRAIQLNSNDPEAHFNLGVILHSTRPEVALQSYLNAVKLRPDYAMAYFQIGNVRYAQGRVGEAIDAYRSTVRYLPKFPDGYNNLGNALMRQGRNAEAMVEYRKSVAVAPRYSRGYYNLGRALWKLKKLREAEAAFRRAIGLRERYATAYLNLSGVLRDQGRFKATLAALKKAAEFGRPAPGLVKSAQELIAVDTRLTRFLKSGAIPQDARECVSLGNMCLRYKRLYAHAARYYAEAFRRQPELAEISNGRNRYAAARAAALAAAGAGKDANGIMQEERTGFRVQAVRWLTANLAQWKQAIASNPKSKADAIAQLKGWMTNPDFAKLRTLTKQHQSHADGLWREVRKTVGPVVASRPSNAMP